MIKSFQDNERATQILVDKLDSIRLYNWEQLTNGSVKTNFVVALDPLDANSPLYFTGKVAIAQSSITETYRSNIVQVTVTVNWVTGSRPQNQSMTTLIAQYGIQSYILAP